MENIIAPARSSGTLFVSIKKTKAMPTRLENSFDAQSVDGTTYRVNVYRGYTEETMLDGKRHVIAHDLAELITSCGKRLNYRGKGKYQFVHSGEELTSNDPNAA